MISQDPLRHSENEATLHAWQSEIERSAPTPWLAQALAARVSDLLPRVTTCHTQLRALPRRTRRAWQRQLARSSKLTAVLQDWSQRRAGRALQRQLARSVAGAALLLALAHGVGHAATITVTTNIPAINAADGKCSLIEAIENANAEALPRPHTDCAAGDAGADIIVLPKATHALGAVNNDTFYATGLPVITSEITIEGHDAKITRKASAPRFRLLAVSATGDLTLKDVTLSGGDAEGYGGAIHNEGTLTIQNSTVSGNDAGFIGGGISNYLGTITIDHSTISGNTAGKGSFIGAGGGIFNDGTVTLTNSTISGNRATGLEGNSAGGGIANLYTLIVEKSTISGNTAAGAYAIGGGIANISGTTTIESSTISGNKANGKYGYGGGIVNASTLTIANSTISGNKAGPKFGYGGGIDSTGDLTLHRSLISGNKAGAGPEVSNYDTGTVTADDFNLFGQQGKAGVLGFSPGPSDIVPGVALGKILAGLADNGGPTKTRALKPGSPAVNAVPSTNPGCTGTDQRGIQRPQPSGAGCDIGAFELE